MSPLWTAPWWVAVAATLMAAAPTPSAPPAPKAPPAATRARPAAGTSRSAKLAAEAGHFIAQGALSMAEAKANLALAADARDPDALYQAARVYAMKGDRGQAYDHLNRALGADRRHAPSLAALVRLHASDGTATQAKPRLQQLANSHPDDLAIQLAYGEALLASGDHNGARMAATRVLKKAETSVAAMKLLARAYLAMKRPNTAEYVLDRALDIARDPQALLLLAQVRLDNDQVVRARVLLEEASEAVPGAVEILNSLGVTYLAVRNYVAAQEVLGRAVAISPGFERAWLNLGSAQRQLGQFDAAEQSWRYVLTLDATMVDAWFNLGVLYLDNPMPGRDRVRQLTDAINAFSGYKRGVAQHEGTLHPETDKFLEEARLLLKQEKERRKEELKTPEGATP